MNEPNEFWQPIDSIVGLFTKEGALNFAKFLLLLASGGAIFLIALYLVTGHGL